MTERSTSWRRAWLVVAVLLSQCVVSTASAASTDVSPAPLDLPIRADVLQANGDGSVTAARCDSSWQDGTAGVVTMDLESGRSNAVSGRLAENCHTGGSTAAPDGTVYVEERMVADDDSTWAFSAFKNDIRIWTMALGFCGEGDGWFGHYYLHKEVVSQAIGEDGNLYALFSSGADCPELHDALVAIDPTTGAVLFTRVLDNSGNQRLDPRIFTHRYGLMVTDGYDVRYFDYTGVEQVSNRFTVPTTSRPVLGTAGRLYFVTYTDCFWGPCWSAVVFHDPDGSSGSVSMIDSGASGTFMALPSYRFAAIDSNAVGIPWHHLTVFGPSGVVDFTHEYADIPDEVVRAALYTPLANGNVLLVRNAVVQSGDRDRRVHLDVLNGTGSVVSSWSTQAIEQDGVREDYWSRASAPTAGRVYISLCDYVCGTSSPSHVVYAVDLSGAALDFPRSDQLERAPGLQRYVALGDSYSSGEGNWQTADGGKAFAPNTDLDDVNECHRSSTSYPQLLDEDESLSLNLTRFAACSGAEASDVVATGQWNEPAQLTALSAATEVVTITVGGNDIGFAAALDTCWVQTKRACTTQLNRSQRLVNGLGAILDTTYRQIREAAPTARVVVAGYPHILPRTRTGWDALTCENVVFGKDNLARMWDLTDGLNGQIRAATRRAGFEFQSVDRAFRGHALCGPDPYFFSLDIFDTEYSYHPDAQGVSTYASLLSARIAAGRP